MTSGSTRAVIASATDPTNGHPQVGNEWYDTSTTPAVKKTCKTAGVWTADGSGSASLTVAEEDGSPSVASVSTIKVSNGTLTNNGSGSVSVNTAGGGGGGGGTAVKSAQVKRTTDQALNNGSETTITWDSENWDTDAFHDNSTNPSRITIPATGNYQFILNGDITAGSSGLIYLKVYVNGVLRIYTNVTPPLSDVTPTRWAFALALSASDYVEIRINQSGGSKNFLGSTGNCTLTVSSM